MGKHKFFVGQAVLVVSSGLADIQKGERFRIVRLLPWRASHPSTVSQVNWTDMSALLVRPNLPP